MTDKIIRNKSRFLKKKYKRYTPEYSRLNKEPEKMDDAALEGFKMNRRIPFVTGGTDSTSQILKNESRNKVFISDHKNNYQFAENEFRSTASLEEDAKKINSHQFKVDDVDLPQYLSQQAETRHVEDNFTDDSLLTTDITDGHYCLYVCETLIYTSESLEDIEEIIEHILFNEKSAKHEEIVVFKKMNIKFGISVR